MKFIVKKSRDNEKLFIKVPFFLFSILIFTSCSDGLNEEALNKGKEYFSHKVLECRGKHYVHGLGITELEGFKYYVESSQLSEADRRNGIEWMGHVGFEARLYRQLERNGQWGEFKEWPTKPNPQELKIDQTILFPMLSGIKQLSVGVVKKNGKWHGGEAPDKNDKSFGGAFTTAMYDVSSLPNIDFTCDSLIGATHSSTPASVQAPTVALAPEVSPTPTETISIKPLKQAIKKKVQEIFETRTETRTEDAKIRKEELNNITKKLQEAAKKEATAQEAIKQQRQQATAREEARMAEADARIAAEDAKNALHNQLRSATSAGTSRAASSSGDASSAQSTGVLEQQYYATIMGHIQQYCQPGDKTWEPYLLAVVSVIIASDGQIVSKTFDQESGDKLFDQSILKILEAANPLPPPPPALQKQRFEIGLRFKPSGIQ